MENCVNCHSPPGGRACCPAGLTPMCLIKNGATESVCLPLSSRDRSDIYSFRRAVQRELIARTPDIYTRDIEENTDVSGDAVIYESFDKRIRSRTLIMILESGNMNEGAL